MGGFADRPGLDLGRKTGEEEMGIDEDGRGEMAEKFGCGFEEVPWSDGYFARKK